MSRVAHLGTAAAGMALGGCGLASPATTLAPKSDFARVSHAIFVEIFWWDFGIFAVVATVLLLAIFRFRERDPEALPPQIRGNAWLELSWTIGPVIALTFIALPTVTAIFRSQATPAADALRVRVIGHQWWWEFQYRDLGVTTASDLHLPVGQAIALDVTSPDVIHSFWVPQLGGKRDTIPGRENHILLTPSTVGEYPGQCAEFCGASHANMRLRVVVETPEAFRAWVAHERDPAAAPPDGSPAAAGLAVFTSGACVGCHTIQGVSGGLVGPNLTHFGTRKTLAGGILDNQAENLARWLANPPAVKPGSLMPDLRLSAAQVQALVAYLEGLK